MCLSRRDFILRIGALCVPAITRRASPVISGLASSPPKCRIQRLTKRPKHHFFGYYGICPWNKSGRYLICLESGFQDHMPSPEEPALIGLVDSSTGAFLAVGETHAWNFQQGTMLHWNPLSPDLEIIYNDRRKDRIASTILNVRTGKKRELPRPINAVSHNGKYALSLTYGRLGRLRKVVGYAGIKDPNPDSAHPENDGVFLMDMTSGRSKLVVSIQRVYAMLKADHPELRDSPMWFNHTVFNKGDTRFFFLARTRKSGGGLETGMFTADLDGSELRQVIPYGKSVSHFDWRNDKEIVATFNLHGDGRAHVLFTDGKNNYQHLGEGRLDFDGHCSFSPDQRWLVTDCKNSKRLSQSLVLYDMKHNECTTLVELDM